MNGESRSVLRRFGRAKAGTSIPALMLPWVLIPAQVPTRISPTVLEPALMLARMPPAVVFSFSRRNPPARAMIPMIINRRKGTFRACRNCTSFNDLMSDRPSEIQEANTTDCLRFPHPRARAARREVGRVSGRFEVPIVEWGLDSPREAWSSARACTSRLGASGEVQDAEADRNATSELSMLFRIGVNVLIRSAKKTVICQKAYPLNSIWSAQPRAGDHETAVSHRRLWQGTSGAPAEES